MTTYSYQGHKRIWKQRDEEENKAILSTIKQGIKVPYDIQPVYLGGVAAAAAAADNDMESEKWDVKRLIVLLRLYGAHRCLWDSRDPDNRNHKLRQAALIDIAAAMGDGVTRKQVLRKINVLRATYRYEKRRIKERIRKGIGAKTKLKWFALADAFLRNVPRADRMRRNDNADSDSDLEDTVVFTIDPETLIPIDECDANVGVAMKLEPSTNEYEENIEETQASLKPSWGPEDSMKFVQLIKENPVLWQQSLKSQRVLKSQALKSIAKQMDRPVQSIWKRVIIFKGSMKKERQKMLDNPAYKPNFIWWPLAESFMNDGEDVSVEWARPKSPERVQLVKSESVEEDEDNSYLDVNPIPSVAPPSVNTMEQVVEELFHKNDTHLLDGPTKIICSNPASEDLLQDKWSLKHSVKFLRLYGSHSCLWDRTDPDYHSRLMRKAALEDIAAAMGNGLDVKFVASKIRIFRVTYMQQRKRMLDAVRRGEKPEFKLRWFPLADSFLRPHIGLRSIKDPSQEVPQFDYQYVYTYLNLIDPELLTDFHGKGTQNTIAIGCGENDDDGEVNDMGAMEDCEGDQEMLID